MNYVKKFKGPYISECKGCSTRITVKSMFHGGYCRTCTAKNKYTNKILKNQVKLKNGYWICDKCVKPRQLMHNYCFSCGLSNENSVKYNNLGQVITNIPNEME